MAALVRFHWLSLRRTHRLNLKLVLVQRMESIPWMNKSRSLRGTHGTDEKRNILGFPVALLNTIVETALERCVLRGFGVHSFEFDLAHSSVNET